MGIWYTTRETVKSALDVKETARSNSQVDKAIESASRAVEGLLHRKFYPMTDTKYFDWPNPQRARAYRLWLDEHEVLSVSSLTSGGETITSDEYFLEPINDPPYDRIELDIATTSGFEVGDTWQRSIVVTGVWGYSQDTEPAGSLNEDLDASQTGVDVTDSGIIGVGQVVKIDSEYMLVTGKRMVDTSVNTGGALTSAKNDVTIAVADGTVFNVDEVLLIDSERMLIVDIAGNNLTVIRAYDGSVLASHDAGADIYAPRTLTVQRGSLGSTAATHTTSTAISKLVIPGLVEELCIAYALNNLLQRQSGYARVAGAGESAREFTGRGIRDIESDAMMRYGRQMRFEAV